MIRPGRIDGALGGLAAFWQTFAGRSGCCAAPSPYLVFLAATDEAVQLVGLCCIIDTTADFRLVCRVYKLY